MKRVLRTLDILTITCVYPLCSFKNNYYNLHLCKFMLLEFLMSWRVVQSNNDNNNRAVQVGVVLLSK